MMTRSFTGLAFGALLLVSSASAQTDDTEFRIAVQKCIEEVRQAHGDRMGRPINTGFDAFVNGPNRVRTIGTESDRFLFTKCMANLGVPVNPA